VQCGIMDQYTLARAAFGNAILLDCRSLEVVQVPVPADIGFILTDSGVRHRLPDGDFNQRTAECAAAVEIIARNAPEILQLRDLQADVLEANKKELGYVLYCCSRRAITENKRVLRTV